MGSSKLAKFPFKSMLAIINYLHLSNDDSAKKFSIDDIMDASNACYGDTFEVVQMMAYITSFGQVKMQDNSWTLTNKTDIKVVRAFRELFLQGFVKILNQLSAEPQPVTVISKNAKGLKEKEIQEYLEFLEKLTAFGYLKKVSDGWNLQSYEKNSSFEINSS